ncbi:hypothetical protein VTL71DRAFT_15625 [Oculimacula yallundae]|uniref:DUF6594 domain-containing protein n=1 Tax=Oculimacula yallundae TaxID=86028 RepID=A0ABR4CIH8_9HELO
MAQTLASDRLASVSLVVKGFFRTIFSTHADATNDISLEAGGGSRTMNGAQEPQLRNRFGPNTSSSTTSAQDEGNHTPDGALTPPSRDEHIGDEVPATGNTENQKKSFFATTLRVLSGSFGSTTSAQRKEEEDNLLAQSRGYALLKKHRYEAYPEGFPRLAAWVSSSESVEIARGFKYLYHRMILQDQVELNNLEKKLMEADIHEASNPRPNFSLRHAREERNRDTSHRDLLETIRVALKRYKDNVIDYRDLQACGKPQKRNFEAYYNWLRNTRQLGQGSDDYLTHVEDMLSLRAEPLSFFDNFVEAHVHHFPISMLKGWLQPQEERDKTSNKYVVFRSDTRRRILAGGLLVLTAVGTLLVPVFLLSLLALSRAQMTAIASVFILIFAWILYVVEEGKVYRVLLGTATYSAILIVFLNINEVDLPVSTP